MGAFLPSSSAPSLPCSVFVFSPALMSLFVVGCAWPLCPKTMHSTCFHNSAGENGRASDPASLHQPVNQLAMSCQTSYKSVSQLGRLAVESITSACFAFMTSPHNACAALDIRALATEQGEAWACLHNSCCNLEGPSGACEGFSSQCLK